MPLRVKRGSSEKYRGCRDAHAEAHKFLFQLLNVPYAQQAQLLEDYCNGLLIDPDTSTGPYQQGKAQENRVVIYYLEQEITALRERSGTQS
jgi:hypothetical protein